MVWGVCVCARTCACMNSCLPRHLSTYFLNFFTVFDVQNHPFGLDFPLFLGPDSLIFQLSLSFFSSPPLPLPVF